MDFTFWRGSTICIYPGDESKNFCLLCLIDVSMIAIWYLGEVGGSIGDGLSNSYESHSVNFPFTAGLILRNQQFQV